MLFRKVLLTFVIFVGNLNFEGMFLNLRSRIMKVTLTNKVLVNQTGNVKVVTGLC